MQGWECPKCGKVYAPWVASCTACVAAPAPRYPRPPTFPAPAKPYSTGDFPESDPKITCGGTMPRGVAGKTITVQPVTDPQPPVVPDAAANLG